MFIITYTNLDVYIRVFMYVVCVCAEHACVHVYVCTYMYMYMYVGIHACIYVRAPSTIT